MPLGTTVRGPPVVGDGQVAPVRQQRLAVGTEDAPEVRGVVQRRVEVDVVDDLDRHQHVDVVDRQQQLGPLDVR